MSLALEAPTEVAPWPLATPVRQTIAPSPDHAGLILGRRIQQRSQRSIGFAAQHEPTIAGDDLLPYSGESHIITFGSTGSGKAVGPMICNALTWPGHLIVMERKGDVFAVPATSMWRRH